MANVFSNNSGFTKQYYILLYKRKYDMTFKKQKPGLEEKIRLRSKVYCLYLGMNYNKNATQKCPFKVSFNLVKCIHSKTKYFVHSIDQVTLSTAKAFWRFVPTIFRLIKRLYPDLLP